MADTFTISTRLETSIYNTGQTLETNKAQTRDTVTITSLNNITQAR